MHKVLAILKECLIPLKKATVLVFGVIGAVADFFDVWIIEVEAVKPFLPYVRQISLLLIVIYIYGFLLL